MKKGEILDKVYKSNLPSRAKQIMFYLINRANVEGTCFPSVKTIASDCGVSERTIQRTMKILMEEGFVTKEDRYRENGGQTSNLYKLKIDFENDNVKTNGNKDFEKENIIEQEESINNQESVEIVGFDDYKEDEEANLDSSEQENESLANIPRDKSFSHKKIVSNRKCHPIRCNRINKQTSTIGTIIALNSLCHRGSDNLYPP